MKKNQFLLKLCIFSFFFLMAGALLSCSSKKEKSPRLSLDGTFYWALGNLDDTIEDAMNLDYKPLPRMGYKNISEVAGKEGAYVWLKTEFEIPDELKGDDLSMVIPYLHFAEILYLNGKYIDDYGVMGESLTDPALQEAGYIAHLFDFPENFLVQDGVNTLLIQVLSLGNATITDGVFVGFRQDCWSTSDNMTFWRARIYIFFEGLMFACVIFFFMVFMAFKREQYYHSFAILNILTLIFFSSFFFTDLPWVGFHGGVSFLTQVKLSKCLSFFGMEFIFTLFIFDFLEVKHHAIEVVMRALAVSVCVLHTLLAPDYVYLMKHTHILLIISSIDLVMAIGLAFKNLASPKVKERSKFLLSAMAPLFTSMVADFIIKGVFYNIKLPYFSLFGWVGFVIVFFVYFTVNYSSVYKKMEYLTRSLEDEVELQTKNLTAANYRLEQEKAVAQEDMSMAAIVQKKFFHAPKHSLKNWEFAVRYEPLSTVSGDLFNFYHEHENLNGISLFDASGHGVAASLVTMLAENIIQQCYRESLQTGESVSKTLYAINERFIEEKAGIENYLTGILLSTKENADGSCTVTMSNAGHPAPLLFVAETGVVEEIIPDIDHPCYGAVGLQGMDVLYSDIEFTMKPDDVLLLYTDGLTEAMSEDGVEFGVERAMTVLNEIHGMSAPEMISALMFAFNAHTYNTSKKDDLSVIILKRK